MNELTKIPETRLLGVLAQKNHERELPKPFAQKIYLSSTRVAGTNYVPNVLQLEPSLQIEDRLRLYREPENPYDKYAILVKTENDEKLGYIPRTGNHIYARLMDAGKLLFAKLISKEIRGEYLDLRIGIYMDD